MAAEIIIVGGCITDLVSYVPRFPKTGETLIGTKFHKALGGKGANQCHMANQLGAKTAMVAKIGNDAFGQEFLQHFESFSTNHDHVTIETSTHTSTAGITVTKTGENTIVNTFGAIDFLTPADLLKAAPDLFPKAKLLVCTYEAPKAALLTALQEAKKYNLPTLVNAAPLGNDHYHELLPFIDFLCVNELEASILCGIPVLNEQDQILAAETLFGKVNQGVILTLGEKGALYCTKTQLEPWHVAASKVEAVDTTGAGDAFNGSLAFYMVKYPQLTMAEKIRRSCVIATQSVLKEGTQMSYPKKSEIAPELFE